MDPIKRFLRALLLAGLLPLVVVNGAGAGFQREHARTLGLPAASPVASFLTDEGVKSLAVAGDMVYAAGFINYVGRRTGAFAALDAYGSPSSARWPVFAGGAVVDAIQDGAGGWLVGGDFTSANGRACPALARVTAAGTLDTRFCRRFEGRFSSDDPRPLVAALARKGATVFLGGNFERMDGQQRLRLAAVDLRSGKLLAWSPPVGGRPYDDRGRLYYPVVSALQVAQGRLFVGGFFERVADAPRRSLAAFELRTGALSPWQPPSPTFSGARLSPPAGVWLAAAGGTLYIWGHFDRLGKAPADGVAAISASTGARLPWSPSVDGGVHAVLAAGDRVFLAGVFSRVGGVVRESVAAVDATTGALVTSFRPPRVAGRETGTREIGALALAGGRLYLGGEFDHIGSSRRWSLAALDARSGRLLSWAPHANSAVYVLRAAAGALAIGGSFSSVGGVPRFGLMAIDGRSGRLLPWAPRIVGNVSALAAAGGRLYVGGDFTRIGGAPRNGLAAFDLATRKLTDWAPSLKPHETFFLVQRLAANRSTVYVVGEFRQANGAPRLRLAAFDARSGALRDWNPGLVSDGVDGFADVTGLQVADGRIYLAGHFVRVGGVAQDGIAELDAESGSVTPWQVDTDGVEGIRAVERSGDTVYVGGDFAHLGGRVRSGLAALDARTQALLPWAPSVSRGWVSTEVLHVTPLGANLAVVGDFRRADGQPHAAVALIGRDGIVLRWRPPATETALFEASSVEASDTVIAFNGFAGGNADSVNVYRLDD